MTLVSPLSMCAVIFFSHWLASTFPLAASYLAPLLNPRDELILYSTAKVGGAKTSAAPMSTVFSTVWECSCFPPSLRVPCRRCAGST